MIRLGANRFQSWLFAGFIVLASSLCIRPPYPKEELLQQTPTVLEIAGLLWSARRLPLTNLSYTLTVLFLCMHVVGARWIYSFVPYDQWTSRLLGFELTELCGFRRNHYDRLTHFCFGLLMLWPIREIVLRAIRPVRGFAALIAVAFVIALAAVYELAEWLVALTFAPDWADRYLGQQGDPWDAQWDMGLAELGAVLALAIAALSRLRDRS